MLDYQSPPSNADAPHPRPQPTYAAPIQAEALQEIFSDCDDFELRPVRVGLRAGIAVSVCWLDGVVSSGDVSEDVLRPLTDSDRLAAVRSSREAARLVEQGAVYRCSTKTRTETDDLVADLAAGHAAVIFEALRLAVTFEVKSTDTRPVAEAKNARAEDPADAGGPPVAHAGSGAVSRRHRRAGARAGGAG